MNILTELTLWFEGFAETDLAIYALALGSFAESIIFPIPVDVLLMPMSLLNPPMAIWFAMVAMVASVLGGIAGYWVGLRFGRPVLHRFVSPAKADSAERLFNKYGAWAVVVAAITPIPYKVFTISAGVLNLELKKFVVASVIGRGFRFLFTGALLYLYGEEIRSFIEDHFGLLMILSVLAAILAALCAVFFVKYRKSTHI
jgi:membrane protein YqaA with SNARE-associated domain